MKKLISVSLCLLLILSALSVGMISASAAQPTGAVTVHKKISSDGTSTDLVGLNGSTFSFYKVMALGTNNAYTLTDDFKNVTGLKAYADTLTQVTANPDDGYVSYGTTTELEKLVGELVVASANVTADKAVTTAGKMNAAGELTETSYTGNELTDQEKADGVTISGVAKADELGYGVYLVVETEPTPGYVDSSQPFLVSVSSQTLTEGNIDVTPKNEKVAVDKKIGSSSDMANAVLSTECAIGDTVPYYFRSKTPNYNTQVLDYMKKNETDKFNALTFTFTDTLSKGLTLTKGTSGTDAEKLKAAFTVKIGGTAFSAFTAAEAAGADNAKVYTLTVYIKDLYNPTDGVNELNKEITVDYNAVLNKDAIVGANENEVELKFLNDPKDASSEISKKPDENPKVYTYQFDLTKLLNGEAFSGNDEPEFTFTKVGVWNNGVQQDLTTEVPVKATLQNGLYVVDATGSAAMATSNGRFSLKGLDEGIYELRETKGVNGYTKLEAPVTIYVKKTVQDGRVIGKVDAVTYKGGSPVSLTRGDTGYFEIEVNNPRNQFTLPLTGAGGVLFFTLCGAGVFALAAVVFFAARRKKTK